MYVCMYVCMYVFMYTQTFLFDGWLAGTCRDFAWFMYVCLYACMHVCICTQTFLFKSTDDQLKSKDVHIMLFMQICMYTYVCIWVCVSVCMCLHAKRCVCECTCPPLFISIHVHVGVFLACMYIRKGAHSCVPACACIARIENQDIIHTDTHVNILYSGKYSGNMYVCTYLHTYT